MKKIIMILLVILMIVPVNILNGALKESSFTPVMIDLDHKYVFDYIDSHGTKHHVYFGQANHNKLGLRNVFGYEDNKISRPFEQPPEYSKDEYIVITHYDNINNKIIKESSKGYDISHNVYLLDYYLDDKYINNKYLYFKLSYYDNKLVRYFCK